ncbi:MAG: hypothetical protein CL940_06755 [Deltaproteobacteria bacterium]|nr:hypothetical protein [Deltaproteobacteria bacterium]
MALAASLAACASDEVVEEEVSSWNHTPSGKTDGPIEQASPTGLDVSETDTNAHWGLDDVEQDTSTDTAGGGPMADTAQDVGPEEPSPLVVPEFSEEPPASCAAADASQWYFQFLDNLCDDKFDPSSLDRERACAAEDSSAEMQLQDGTWVTYYPSGQAPAWDTTSLAGLVPDSMEISVILIKRVNGVPHYRYLSNGRHDVSFQPWSTTKVLAAANAGSYLRLESNGEVGLDANAGSLKLGDLVTSLVNYDNQPYTSNGLGAYFHHVGGRQRADDLIGPLWLNRPETETFGGNYGDSVPPVGYTYTAPNGAELTITPDQTGGYANHLSTATLAEAVKRLVLHREEPAQRLPGLDWKDVQVLLYGAEDSASKGSWGGMSADTAVYLQTGHDMDYIEERSQGEWMTFSKLGLGTKGQFVHMGYACFPVLDDAGQAVTGHGREFVIAAHLKEGGGGWVGRDRELARIYRRIELRIVDGRL